MDNKIVIGFLIAGIIECLFFSLLFSSKTNKKLPDKIAGIWLLVLAIQIIFITIAFQKQSLDSFYRQVQVSFLLLHGPFLFLYADKLTSKTPIFKLKKFLHFIPFVVIVAIAFFFICQNRIPKISPK